MIQTNYVPLEHPYRVVYYNGVIGIQIGSLILTIEKQDEEGKRIVEIKTHPVVSYSSTEKKKEIAGASYPGLYAEAVVWDKVEQCEVTTLAIENGKINWDELFYETRDYIWKIYQKSEIDGYSAVIRFSDALERLGVEVSFPDSSNIVRTEVCLCTWKDGEVQKCGAEEFSVVQIETAIDKDEDEIAKALWKQLEFHRYMVKYLSKKTASPRNFEFDFAILEDTAFLRRLALKLKQIQEEMRNNEPDETNNEE